MTANVTQPATWYGPCSTQQGGCDEPHHASWDLNVGDAQAWVRAVKICAQECPVRGLCVAARNEFFPHSNPSGVIWAGVAYSETGRVLDADGLRRLAAVQRNKPFRGKPRRPAAVSTQVA